MTDRPVEINITIRTTAADGYTDYEDVHVNTWYGEDLRTHHVPAVGDVIGPSGGFHQYKILERYWNYPAYGSAAYPHGDPNPPTPRVHFIVERAAGPYTNERPTPEENPDA